MSLDLITLAEYKAYARIVSEDQDDKLNLFIPSVSTLVKNYCGRTFIDHAVTATTEYCSEGGPFVYTKEQPILTVTSVESRSSPLSAYTTLVVNVDYVVDQQFQCLRNISNSEGFYSGPNATKIVYTGGYVTTPEDLKLAVLDLVQYYMKGESAPRKSLNSNQISIEHVKSQDFPPHIKRVLELYRIQ